MDIGSYAGQKTFMPFCAALPYRAAVLADETTSATVVEGFASTSTVKRMRFPRDLADLREVFIVHSWAYQKGSCVVRLLSVPRKSDAQAIIITILFSMKPGWIWEGEGSFFFGAWCNSMHVLHVFLYKRYVYDMCIL